MGPLTGVRVVEIASAAPAPFGCMLLADLGADVLRIDRPDAVGRVGTPDPLARGKRSAAVDLKQPGGAEAVRSVCRHADVLVEGFRPGVMERLGLGPAEVLAANPGLVYARMTGWGQAGPLAAGAGHDINYIGLAGALDPIGRPGERPVPPLNLVGDFGGGGMLLAVGVLAALVERAGSGRGQVIDVAMVDGSALLTAFLHGLRAGGQWSEQRGTNLLDGGAPFYDTYETADGEHVAVGALERRFYAQLLDGLGLANDAELPAQHDRSRWAELRARFAAVFKTRTRNEWAATFAGTDACVTPVLRLDEVATHEHVVARDGFVEVDGLTQPAPAPRFARTPAEPPRAAPLAGEHTVDALREWGLAEGEIARLHAAGIVRQLPAPAAVTP